LQSVRVRARTGCKGLVRLALGEQRRGVATVVVVLGDGSGLPSTSTAAGVTLRASTNTILPLRCSSAYARTSHRRMPSETRLLWSASGADGRTAERHFFLRQLARAVRDHEFFAERPATVIEAPTGQAIVFKP
jgi:hypothetical protein